MLALTHRLPTSRNTSITAERLEDYRDLIKTATDDLEARLESIDEKLETIFARTATESETTELRRIKEERLSTQKCLLICAQLSEHINQVQPILGQGGGNPSTDPGILPKQIANDGIQECRISLDKAAARLERHMQDIMDKLVAKQRTVMNQDEVAELNRLREEWTTARQCRDICSKADQNLKENITVIDNHATGDETVQFLVSTSQKTIHGKNRGYGFRIRQVGGHLSDESVQQMSRDISRISMTAYEAERPRSASEELVEKRTSWQNYGSGRKLVTPPSQDVATAPEWSHDARYNNPQGRSNMS